MNYLIFLTSLFSFNLWAGPPCEFHYSFNANKRVFLLQEINRLNIHENFSNTIVAMKREDQILFQMYLEHFDIDLQRAEELFSSRTSQYLIDDVFHFRRLILDEKYLPNYAQTSLDRFNEFKRLHRRARNYPNDIASIRNPTAHEQVMDRIYHRIVDFYADRITGFKYMQELEDIVAIESLRSAPRLLGQNADDMQRIRVETLHNVLSEWEIKNGFKSVNDFFYEPRLLPDTTLNAHMWAEMLREGHMFIDYIFDTRRALTDATIDESHGAFTHRIQFYLLHRDIENAPTYYQGMRGVDIFTSVGNIETNLKYLRPNTLYRDDNSLWFNLFDYNGQETVFHSPETFMNLQERFWPHLGPWP